MKLFAKETRRYREAEPSEILLEASRILRALSIDDEASVLYGIALSVRANGEYRDFLEAKRLDSMEKEDRNLLEAEKKTFKD